jgi:hypoxanthine-DNA glycosylase
MSSACSDASVVARSSGFPPAARADARLLILGSLPGQRSLQEQQYYAQPRNAFWPLMGRLFDAGPEHAYAERLQRLVESRVALWDVCASANRPGSLDQKIDRSSVTPNDFVSFFENHRGIKLICFNGATAQRLFMDLVAPGLSKPIPTLRLPSTSPAHASLDFERKLAAWAEIGEVLEK